MKTFPSFLFVVASLFSLLNQLTWAEQVYNANINATIDTYIPEAGRSYLLQKGTSAQVLATEGDNAIIAVTLQNGYSVQTEIPTKYLTIQTSKQKQQIDSSALGPNPITVSPIEPPKLPETQTASVVAVDDFFNIQDIVFHSTSNPGESQVTKTIPQLDANNKPMLDKTNNPILKDVPIPFLAANIIVKAQIKTSDIILKAYFYDQTLKLIATARSPFTSDEVKLPVFLPKDTKQPILFVVPDNVLSQENWSAIVICGDTKGVDAQVYSEGNEISDYDFPEKNIIENKNGPPIERKSAMDPLMEHVVQTFNPNQPQISIFMRPPIGMTDASEAKGVLAVCLLAGSVDGVKRQLQDVESEHQLTGILKFADDHELIVIGWGAKALWDSTKSWDEQTADKTWSDDKTFDKVADAWAKGVQYFVRQYGIPPDNYLLWGESGSAQYACRLALRKPDYFLAVHVHIPSSFDKPTPEASRILWCLTTGELEAGHDRSLRFYSQCREMGYPMIYKAIIGLGHEGSPIADNLGAKFYEYALSIRDQRSAYNKTLNDPLKQLQMKKTGDGQQVPWLLSFQKPDYMGDIINQDMYPASEEDRIPMTFRVPLPTRDIAEAWNH